MARGKMDDHVSATRRRFFGRRIGGVLAMLLVFQTPVSSQSRIAAEVPFSSLKAADYAAVTYIPPYRGDSGKRDGSQSATFEIQFSSNFPEAAREAFEYAADVWGRYLNSPEPIVVDAEWTALDEGTLGSAGPLLVGNFPQAQFQDVWYPASLANLFMGGDVSTEQPDIFASFNSDFSAWYFGIDGQVPSNRYDFVTVILHELGHGLGFSGSFKVDDGDPANSDECPGVGEGWGCWGIAAERGGDVFPMVFDLFTEDGNEISLLLESVYPNPSTELGATLTSNAVFFDGDFSRPLNEDVPIDLYAPRNFDVGSSYSHLDESQFRTPAGGSADPDALMTPFLARGEAIHSPGLLTCAIFEDFGWEMGDGCLALLASSADDPGTSLPTEAAEVGAFHPNPTAGAAAARIRLTTPQSLVVEVFNVAGRRMAREQRHVEAGSSNEIRVDTGAWAPGIYFVRIYGDTVQVTKSIVATGG